MRNGFTIIEVLVTMMLAVIIISFSTVSILNLQHRTYLNSRLITLINDLRSWQVKAMTGEIDDTGQIVARGVYFGNNFYTLFRGQVYNPNDNYNFTVQMEDGLVFDQIGQSVVFLPGSGQIASSATVTLRQGNGLYKNLSLNAYGTVFQID